MRRYFHEIGSGMYVGDAVSSRQLLHNEAYLIFLGQAGEDETEKDRGTLRNLVNQQIGLLQCDIAFNRADAPMRREVLAAEFTHEVPDEYKGWSTWLRGIQADLGSIAISDLFIRFQSGENGMNPVSARLTAIEGEKVRVIYVEDQKLRDSRHIPAIAVDAITAKF